MKIKVHDIPHDGLEIKKVISCKEIGLTEDEARCLSDLKIHANIQKADEALIADTEVKGTYRFDCARCLEPVEQERADQFQIFFDIDPTVEFVDLGEEIRQELIVAVSDVTICSENCKGLCPGCGANLNKEKCRCKGSKVKKK